MNILDLPIELQLQIVGQLDDVFEYLRLARVCKRFQSLVKSIVLVLSDLPHPSPLFKSILKDHVQIKLDAQTLVHSELKSSIRSHQYFVFEFFGMNLTQLMESYICLIADYKPKVFQKIDVVIMNQNAALTSKSIIFDPRSFVPEKLSQVSRTIFAYDSDKALNVSAPEGLVGRNESMMLMSNAYYMDNVEYLPQLYVYASPRYNFKIMSPSLKVLSGITNVNDRLPRLPTLFYFLHYSSIPNLEVLTGLGIESGMDLRVFERFKKLEKLHLDSVFTGNLALNVAETRPVSLRSLVTFKVSGNSISISDLFLPNLKTFDITISGSTERNFRSTIHMVNIQTPKLERLYISASNVSDAPTYILRHLDISNTTVMCIYSSNCSSFPKLEQIHFPKLQEMKLGALNASTDEFTPVPFKLDAPNLILLNVKNLQIFNQVLFNSGISYKGLKSLYIHLKVLPDPQKYEFSQEFFPDLEVLDIGYFNQFGRLISNNIDLVLNLPTLKQLTTKQAIFDKIVSTSDLRSGDIELNIISVPGMNT